MKELKDSSQMIEFRDNSQMTEFRDSSQMRDTHREIGEEIEIIIL